MLPTFSLLQNPRIGPFHIRGRSASFLFDDAHHLNNLSLYCALRRVTQPNGASCYGRDILTLPLVPFVFSIAHLLYLTLIHNLDNILKGLFLLREVLSSLLSILGILRQLPLFHNPFNKILQLDLIIRVVVVTLVEMKILRLIILRRLSNWKWVPYPGLLELYVCALLQDPLS